ncbi:LysM peptidoglycan-binding domain-containing protein [Nioella aestuarii]|uniref:LysM peptidoglycan-binding domain-containing protein n=1 Tax=Nioella aestuarii TaxID=1662864 RepID=UPI003D7FD3FC
MAASAGSGLGLGTLAAGVAVAAVVGVVGYQIIFAPGPDPDPGTPPQDIAAEPGPDPVVEPDATSDAPVTAPEIAEESEAPSALIAPSFDLVRVDAAGGALIAGQAEGNAELRLRLDGQEIHMASSDAGGEFVAMFDIPPSELPRILSLEMVMEDGSVLVSEQSVIISPTLRPAASDTGVEVAAAEATGPELPSDSGVSELAMASEPDSPPVGGTAPIAPVTPDLPEQGSVAAAEDASVELAEETANLSESAPDDAPTTDVPDAVESASDEGGEDAPILDMASVEPEDSEGLTRSIQDGSANPETGLSSDADTQRDQDGPGEDADGAEPAEGSELPAIVEAVDGGDQPDDIATAPAQLTAEALPTENEGATENATAEPDSPVVVADGSQTPVADEDSQDIATAAPSDEPIIVADGEDTAIASDGATELAIVEGADDAPAVAAEALTQSDETPVASDDVTELAMADSAEDTPSVATDTPVSSGETPNEPAGSQPDPVADDPTSENSETPVLEPQTPTVLLADSQGIRVIQSGDAAPQVQSQVTLDTIAYDTVGDVVLAGRGRAESDVRFYLNNQPIHLAPIDVQGGWRTALPQVDPGTYTLRLDEVSADGAVQSRIETPFLREEPETVAAITSSAGADVITVQWGNTLWGIAQQHLGEGVAYVQIYEANRDQIRNPDLIYPGQIFTLPDRD